MKLVEVVIQEAFLIEQPRALGATVVCARELVNCSHLGFRNAGDTRWGASMYDVCIGDMGK